MATIDRHLQAPISQPAVEEFVAVSCIAFTDGGPNEYMLLHRGSKESCHDVAELISGLSYSGSRPIKDGKVVWMPSEIWDKEPA